MRPAGRVVEAGEQVEDGGLAGARAADEGDALAGLDGEVEALERDVAVGIGEVARPRSGSGRWRGRCVSGPSMMVFSASKSMKTRSSAAAPCWTVAKLPPSRRAGPAMTPRPVRRPVKSAMVIVPAWMRRPTTKRRSATARPTRTSIIGATRACQRFWRRRRPKRRSKTPSALCGERLLEAVGAGHADAGEALGDLGGHRRDLGLGAPWRGARRRRPMRLTGTSARAKTRADADGQRPVDAEQDDEGDDDGQDAGDAAEERAHGGADQRRCRRRSARRGRRAPRSAGGRGRCRRAWRTSSCGARSPCGW